MVLSNESGDRNVVSVNGTSGEVANMATTDDRRTPSYKREVSWQAHTIDANAVHKTLTRLWTEVSDERRAASGRPRRESDAAMMRTRTINLICVSDDIRHSERINQTVISLSEFFPSRSVLLVRRPPESLKDGLAVKVAVEEFRNDHNQTPVRFETITVAVAGREELLASVASPILLPELPDFVWYPSGSFAESPLLGDLLDIADRLIVDSSYASDPSQALRFLNSLESGPGDGELHLSDAAWTRLTPWRQMIAQFFDQAAMQPCLDTIETVTITSGARDVEGRSGLTAGLMMAGWLCTRLGWRAPGEELVRTRDGWKLTLRAGQRGRSREVILTLKQTENPAVGPCLGSVEIMAGGNAPGLFKIERINPESVETTSEMSTKVSRVVYVRNLDDGRLLSLELRIFGSDPMYHEALDFAANLWPEGVTV